MTGFWLKSGGFPLVQRAFDGALTSVQIVRHLPDGIDHIDAASASVQPERWENSMHIRCPDTPKKCTLRPFRSKRAFLCFGIVPMTRL